MLQNDLINAKITIGKKLQMAREARSKTIKEAAIEAGVKPRTLVGIEAGVVNFRLLTLVKICKAYNLKLETLMEGITAGMP